MKMLLKMIVFIVASKGFFSYANCPTPATFEVTDNLTFIAKTEQGIWQQIYNYQSYYYQQNYASTEVSLFFVIAHKENNRQFFSNHKIHSNKIICIYQVSNKPGKFIILKNPENTHYEINVPTRNDEINGWRDGEQTPYCFTKTLPARENIDNYTYCNFNALN
ncbi:hypothetical protein [Spirobacillus cienkowskii]|uniref:hypothetical protein n=1 Tax=Spirobacillus cienkowskii TaxID=495820 RepID=UPI0030CB968E